MKNNYENSLLMAYRCHRPQCIAGCWGPIALDKMADKAWKNCKEKMKIKRQGGSKGKKKVGYSHKLSFHHSWPPESLKSMLVSELGNLMNEFYLGQYQTCLHSLFCS